MEKKEQVPISEKSIRFIPVQIIPRSSTHLLDHKNDNQAMDNDVSLDLLRTLPESVICPPSTKTIIWNHVKTMTTIASYSLIVSIPNFFLMQQFSKFKHGFRAIAYIFGLDTLILEPITTLMTPAANLVGEAHGRSTSTSISNIEINKSKKKVGVIFRQLKLLAFISSLPSIAILLLFKTILSNFDQPKEALALAQKIFNVYSIGILPQQLLRANFQLLSGLNRSKLMLKVLVGYSCLNTGLAYLLMKKTNLGLTGYAWSFVITSVLVDGGIEVYLKYNSKFKDYELFRSHQCCTSLYNSQIFKRLLSLGWPVAIKTALEELGLFTSSLLSMGISKSASEAFQTVRAYILPLTSYNIYAASMHSALISQAKGLKKADEEAYGRQDSKALTVMHRSGLAYGTGFGLMSLVILFFLYKPFSFIFTSDAEVVELTKYIFLIQGSNLALDGVRNMQTGTLRAFDDTKTPMYWNALSFLLLSIGGWFLGFKTKLKVYGVTLARTVAIGIAACALTERTMSAFNKLKQYGFAFFDTSTIEETEEKEPHDKDSEANIESYHEPLLQSTVTPNKNYTF